MAKSEKKTKRGRPTKYKPDYCDAIIEHMKDGASMASFAASIGVCRATLNVWAGEHPDFLEAIKRGKAACASWWEERLRTIASAGGTSAQATASIFGLKNMAADDWRDNKQLEHSGPDGGPIVTKDVTDLTDEQLAAIAAAGRD